MGDYSSLGFGQYARFLSQTVGAFLLVLIPFCLYWGYFAFFEIIWDEKLPASGWRVFASSIRADAL